MGGFGWVWVVLFLDEGFVDLGGLVDGWMKGYMEEGYGRGREQDCFSALRTSFSYSSQELRWRFMGNYLLMFGRRHEEESGLDCPTSPPPGTAYSSTYV